MGRPTLEQELEAVRYNLVNAKAFVPPASRSEIREWKSDEVDLVAKIAVKLARVTKAAPVEKKRGRPKGSKNKVTTPVAVTVPVQHPLEQVAEKRREIAPTPVHNRRGEYDDPFPEGTEALLDGRRTVECLGAYTRASTLFIIPGEAGDLKHVVSNKRLEKV